MRAATADRKAVAMPEPSPTRPGRPSLRGVHTRHAEAHKGCTPWRSGGPGRCQNRLARISWRAGSAIGGRPRMPLPHRPCQPPDDVSGLKPPRARRRLPQKDLHGDDRWREAATSAGLIEAGTFDADVRALCPDSPGRRHALLHLLQAVRPQAGRDGTCRPAGRANRPGREPPSTPIHRRERPQMAALRRLGRFAAPPQCVAGPPNGNRANSRLRGRCAFGVHQLRCAIRSIWSTAIFA